MFFNSATVCLYFSGGSTGKESRPLRWVWSCTRMPRLQLLVFPWICSPKNLAPTPMSLLFRSLSFSLQIAVHRGSWNVLVSQILLIVLYEADFQDRWLVLECIHSLPRRKTTLSFTITPDLVLTLIQATSDSFFFTLSVGLEKSETLNLVSQKVGLFWQQIL